MMPKLQRILAALSARLEGINTAAGYYTNAGQHVQRGMHTLDPRCLPGIAVYVTGRELTEAQQPSTRASCLITVEAVSPYAGDHPEDMACMLAADIQTAVEAADRTLGGLVLTDAAGGLAWQSDEIIYPEASDPLVGVRVNYAVPHIRRPGDPENA